MLARLALVLLVAGGVLISGCTQSPAPAGGAAATIPTPATGGGGAATPAVTTTGGSAEAFGAGILNCQKGTPWTFSGAEAGAEAFKVTYTIDGYTAYKGSQYCKVIGKVEATGIPGAENFVSEYYFKLNPAASAYSEVCCKIVAGQGVPATEGCITPRRRCASRPLFSVGPSPGRMLGGSRLTGDSARGPGLLFLLGHRRRCGLGGGGLGLLLPLPAHDAASDPEDATGDGDVEAGAGGDGYRNL